LEFRIGNSEVSGKKRGVGGKNPGRIVSHILDGIGAGVVFVAFYDVSGVIQQGYGAVPRGRDFALLSTVVVDVVVLVVARIGNPQDFVDIIAVDVPGLLVVAGIGFPGAPGPLFAVVVAPAIGACFGIDLFDPPAEGVVGVFSHVGVGAVLDPDDAVLVVVFVLVDVLVGGQVAGVVIAETVAADFIVAVVVGIDYVCLRPDSKVYRAVPVAKIIVREFLIFTLNAVFGHCQPVQVVIVKRRAGVGRAGVLSIFTFILLVSMRPLAQA